MYVIEKEQGKVRIAIRKYRSIFQIARTKFGCMDQLQGRVETYIDADSSTYCLFEVTDKVG